MRKLYKYGLMILIGYIALAFLSTSSVRGYEQTALFYNLQNENSDFSSNYGSLVSLASDNNNYRNTFDTSTKGSDYIFDDMVDLSNTVDYSNYIYSQQYYNYSYDSFNMTNGNYQATYTFDNDIGSNPTDWTVYEPTGTSINVESNYNSHYSIVHLIDSSGTAYCQMDNSFSNQVYGTFEFWILAASIHTFYIYLYSDSNYMLYIEFGNTGNINWYSSTTIGTYLANQWYHFSVDFCLDSSGYKGLSQYGANIRYNGNQVITNSIMVYHYSYLNDIRFKTAPSDTSSYYVDAIGYSWSSGYTLGSNELSEYQQNLQYNRFDMNLVNTYPLTFGVYQDIVDIMYFDGAFYYIDSINRMIGKFDSNLQLQTKVFGGFTDYSAHSLTYSTYTNKIYALSTGKIWIFDTSFNLLNITSFSGSYWSIEAFRNYLLATRYTDDGIIVDKVSLDNISNSNKEIMYNDTTFTMNSLVNFYDTYLLSISPNTPYTWKLYNPDNNFSIIESGLFDYIVDSGSFVGNRLYVSWNSGGGTDYIYQYNFDCYNFSKGFMNQYYLYDDSNNLKGKLECGIINYIYLNDTIFANFQSLIYTYSGSFSLIDNSYQGFFININNYSTFEIHSHIVIGYQNTFKKLFSRLSVYSNNQMLIAQISKTLDFMSSYRFDKIILNLFSVFQNKVSYIYDDKIYGYNLNYFRNDIIGLRFLFSNDFNQKYTSYINFGFYNDIIDITKYFIPKPTWNPEIPPDATSWSYLGYTLSTGSSQHVDFPHFPYDYIMLESGTITMWYDYTVLDLATFTGNLFLDIFIGLGNLIAMLVSWIWYGIQYLFYLLIIVIDWIFLYVIATGMSMLFWNILLFWLVYLVIGFAELCIVLFVDYLPPFISFCFQTLIPFMLDLLASLIGIIVGSIVYALSGGQGNITDIINVITNFVSQVFDFLYQIVMVFIDNLVNILLFIGLWLIICYGLYFKYIYTKPKGYVNRNYQIEVCYKTFSLPFTWLSKATNFSYNLIPMIR